MKKVKTATVPTIDRNMSFNNVSVNPEKSLVTLLTYTIITSGESNPLFNELTTMLEMTEGINNNPTEIQKRASTIEKKYVGLLNKYYSSGEVTVTPVKTEDSNTYEFIINMSAVSNGEKYSISETIRKGEDSEAYNIIRNSEIYDPLELNQKLDGEENE